MCIIVEKKNPIFFVTSSILPYSAVNRSYNPKALNMYNNFALEAPCGILWFNVEKKCKPLFCRILSRCSIEYRIGKPLNSLLTSLRSDNKIRVREPDNKNFY